MADTALPLIKAVIAALKAEAEIAAVVGGRVFTDVPQEVNFPYVRVSVESEPYSAQDFSGQTHNLRVQTFGRKPGAEECLNLRRLCTAVLDRQEDSLVMDDGTLVRLDTAGAWTLFQEDDGRTWQAVAEFDVVLV